MSETIIVAEADRIVTVYFVEPDGSCKRIRVHGMSDLSPPRLVRCGRLLLPKELPDDREANKGPDERS